ncbi:hypothetical protein [Deinococcus radiophilus]|uniref:hypothetical protein n=1 Tax=Deinococcus radiophilus TaxID=32062 RepID=UPI001E521D49|nr:hypothetical protein [Deinococcus radiophilus]UFA49856.1 hypothetical protein LMT64_08125 [Deinococcus radiophilus]
MCSQAKDIVSLRLSHCRAERAAQQRQYHLAALHYRHCLETAELREDCQAVRFFALRLADCYEQMELSPKAQAFRDLAGEPRPAEQRRDSRREGDGTAGASIA